MTVEINNQFHPAMPLNRFEKVNRKHRSTVKKISQQNGRHYIYIYKNSLIAPM